MNKLLQLLSLQFGESTEETILDKSMHGKHSMEYNLNIGDETLLHGEYRYPRSIDLKSI
jgi:hypothetical protein